MVTHFITGGAGFVGRHIAGHLLARGDRVIATHHPESGPDDLLAKSGMVFEPWLLGDDAALGGLLKQHQPKFIYHLASPAHVPSAQAQPRKTAQDVFLATVDLLEIVRRHGGGVRLLYVGSAEEYVDTHGAQQTEHSPVAGHSAYGICKAAATQWVATMAKDFAVCVRPFNQIGPYQSPRFAVASFADQIAAIARGEAEPVLRVGNLDVERDFIDVRDSSLAHIMALEQGRPGEIYNIASGQGTQLRMLVEHMITLSGINIKIEVDPARVRSGDIARIVGDAGKLRKDTGWTPSSSPQVAAGDALRTCLGRNT